MTENDYCLLYDIASKRIIELEQKLEQTEKDLADYQFNYPTIKELEKENRLLGERCNQLLKDKGELTDQLTEKDKIIEKLLDFVVERTVCCDVCPNFDTCRNNEGTCPHAGLLKENEEKVTREWILKSITKE